MVFFNTQKGVIVLARKSIGINLDDNDMNSLNDNFVELYSGVNRVTSDKGISTNLLADGAVTNSKIGDGAITGSKLNAGVVSNRNLAEGAVQPENIVNNAIRENHLAGNSVGTTKIIDNSVTESKLNNGAVSNSKLGTDSVTNSKIQNGSVTGEKLNAGVVSNRNLANNAVQPDNIVNNAIQERHLAGKIITQSKVSDDLSADISKTDVKIFGAIEYEEINRSKIRIKKPVQSLGYLASGGTFKWINDIIDNVELNQNESIVFNVKDGTTYVDTTQINSAQITNGRFGIDDEIVLISYLGYGRVTSPAELFELNNDSTGVSLLKGPNYITIHVQQEGSDYVGYNFLKIIKSYVPGDKTSHIDIWSFRKFAEYKRTGKHTFTHVRDLYDNATQDLMIRESGVSDYMGGAAHGDEIKQSLKIYLDDKELDEGTTYTNMYGKEFKMILKTHLYRDTDFTNGDLQHLATAYKTYTVNKDGYTLDVEVEWHEEVTLRECQIGALSLNKKDEQGNFIFNEAVLGGMKEVCDMTATKSEFNRVSNVDEVYFKGDDLTLNWSATKFNWLDGNSTVMNQSNAHMNKLYPNYILNGYTTKVNEVFKQTTKYKLNKILN